mgnify:CR=1 FL=1
MTAFQKRILLFLLILALLSPLGLVLPEVFRAGDAWGEWGLDTIEQLLGYVPEGMKRLAELWKAPVPDYSLKEDASLTEQVLYYIFSALAGVVIVGAVIFIIGKLRSYRGSKG